MLVFGIKISEDGICILCRSSVKWLYEESDKVHLEPSGEKMEDGFDIFFFLFGRVEKWDGKKKVRDD